jgi:hypothetical protein
VWSSSGNTRILWLVDPLLGGDREIGDSAAARKNSRGMVFSARSAKQQLNSNRGTVFSVRSCRNVISNELVVVQSPVGKNMSTEAEDIVGIRHQATTGEDTAN